MATDIIARGLATSNSGGGGGGTSVDIQAGVAIELSGADPVTINNNGVTDVQPGTNNGTVKVVIAGKESKSKEVPVKGLNNAAYKDVDTVIDETTKDSENLPTTKAVKESLDKKIDTSKLEDSNGVATLDENKKLKSAQLPSHNHGSNEVNTMMGYSKPSTLTDKAIKNTDTLNVAIGKLEKNLDDKMDNGNYAGSSSKGGSATSAEKLTNTEQVGTSAKPVYFSADGVPVAIDYKLEKDVPSTAKLTDTTYSAGTGLRIDNTDNNKIHNMGVLSVNESATNGSIDITIGKNGAETSETKSISIHGLADAAYKDVDKAFGVPTLDANVKISVNQIPTTDNYNVDSAYPVTSKAVKAAIDTLPNPMVFKGSLGVGGTITALPTAESGNEGFTYKVITNGEYAGQTAKIGDLFISDGSSWIYIPSADEPDGTVTSVGISVPTGLKVKDGTSPITTSGTIEVELDEGYVIPKSADIVPSTRKVNEKVLSADIVLNGADIKADGYTKPKSASAIEATDTVNQAFGKLEYKADTNAANIAKNKTNISTLAKHMTGDLTDSDFQEDSTVAMTKTVPSGMGDYAAIKVIGGKTVKDEENQVLKNAVVESVVSTSADGTTETTLLLPESIKSLPDWGCAVNDEIYNWVDFENMVYHHVVSKKKGKELNWVLDVIFYTKDITSERYLVSNYEFVNVNATSKMVANSLLSTMQTTYRHDIVDRIYFKNTSISTLDDFKTAIAETEIVYELANEELIDISDILHPIRCESGGTITFTNEHNLDMSNTVVYKKEVSLI